MSLSTIALSDITPEHLDQLVANGATEGHRLDAKVELPGSNDAEKREFLRDVTSFANADGGDILYGVLDTDGVITGIPGIGLENIEGEILRLTQLARNCSDPRIFNLHMEHVRLANGQVVIVVRIPKSLDAPHMITYQGYNQFWIRQNTGKAPMTTNDVRTTVLRSAEWRARVEQNLRDRLAQLTVTKSGPIGMIDGPVVVSQLIPLGGQVEIDLSVATVHDALRDIAPPHASGWNTYHTFDGLLVSDGSRSKAAHSYRLCYHDGRVESVSVDYYQRNAGEAPRISVEWLERSFTELITDNLKAAAKVGILPPFVILICMHGFNDYDLDVGRQFSDSLRDRLPITQDLLVMPLVVLHEYPANVRDAILPILDRLWQTAGFAAAPRNIAG